MVQGKGRLFRASLLAAFVLICAGGGVDTLGAGQFGAKPLASIMSSVPVSSAAPPVNSAPLN